MTGQTLSAERKSTPLESVVNDLSNQLERMAKNTTRLELLGNKFKDESSYPKECNPEVVENKPNGVISTFEVYVSKLESLNHQQDALLNKLEGLI